MLYHVELNTELPTIGTGISSPEYEIWRRKGRRNKRLCQVMWYQNGDLVTLEHWKHILGLPEEFEFSVLIRVNNLAAQEGKELSFDGIKNRKKFRIRPSERVSFSSNQFSEVIQDDTAPLGLYIGVFAVSVLERGERQCRFSLV